MPDENQIREKESQILKAIEDYTGTGIGLLKELLKSLDLPHNGLDDELRFRLDEDRQEGDLAGGWQYRLHGGQSSFLGPNDERLTVHLRYLNRADQVMKWLDPYFLGHYIKSSQKFPEVAALIDNEFNDTLKILEVLEEKIRSEIKWPVFTT